MFILEALEHYAKTDRIAIRYHDEQLSYAALNRAADAFAAYLRRELPDGGPVMIYGHKQSSIPACMFGALKAGRGYIPVDTTYPPERAAQILREAQPSVLIDLCGSGLSAAHTLCEAALAPILAQSAPPAPRAGWLQPEQTAYLLFTSGSTGTPKGVQITAGNLAAFHAGAAPWFARLPEGGSFLNEISYSFDVSVCALYEALSRGMTLWTADRQTLADPQALFALLREARPDAWVSTPSLAEFCVHSGQFCAELLPQVRQFLFCGEVLTKKLTAELFRRFPGVPVINAYGPTETTVLVTGIEITQAMLDAEAPLPIGHAFDNVRAVIADAQGHPLPDGEAGELLIAGKAVSPGYLNRPERNAASFFETQDGLRGYRTGDLCRMENGMLYYLGRLDGQIKLNGFRVELEDVENNLVKLPNIARAAVLPVLQDGRVTALTAAVLLEQPDGEGALQRARRIKAALAGRLPSYMIPRKILAVDSFPLNTNGKIDKTQLAAQLSASATGGGHEPIRRS